MIVPRWIPSMPPVCAAKISPEPTGNTTEPSLAAAYVIVVPSGMVASTSSHAAPFIIFSAGIAVQPSPLGTTGRLGLTATTKGRSSPHNNAKHAALAP